MPEVVVAGVHSGVHTWRQLVLRARGTPCLAGVPPYRAPLLPDFWDRPASRRGAAREGAGPVRRAGLQHPELANLHGAVVEYQNLDVIAGVHVGQHRVHGSES